MKGADSKVVSPDYGDKVERIYRILLSRQIKKLTWYRIAKDADVVFSWAHHILKGLENEGLLKKNKVIDAKAIFQRWAKRPDKRKYREYHIQKPEAILKKNKLDYVLTGYQVEHLVGDYLFPRYHELYIRRKDASAWHEFLTKNGYVGKGNVQIILADEHVFYERKKIKGWPVVSIQQLIADLYRNGAECAEAADMLVSREYK